MANPYVSMTWEDRNSEFPNRRLLTDTTDPTDIKQVYVERDEGQDTGGSYKEGTPLTAQTFNNLEGRINSAFSALDTRIVAVEFTELTGTLTAGSTSLTLQDASIETTSTLDVFTSVYGIAPESITVSTGSITLTFETQSSDLGVKVRVY